MVSTPAPCEAATTCSMSAATWAGFEPYCRWNAPIGGLPSPSRTGTVSATGARLTVTPMPASRRAVSRTVVRSAAGGPAPSRCADGISGKSGPFNVCTLPPS
jgi:hypothetical protein